MQGYLWRYKKPVKYKTNKGGGAGLDQKKIPEILINEKKIQKIGGLSNKKNELLQLN